MQLSHKFMWIGGSIITVSALLGFFAFDHILRFGVKDQTTLRKRNDVRKIYLKLPFPLDFRVYFFNVSNPMEVQNGETPVLQEIGPYCYDEYKEKIDVVDNAAEDTLTYTPYDIFKFNQEKSGALKEDDTVTIIHPLLVGMVNQVTRDSPALLSIVNKAIGLIFPHQQSIYLTTKVKDILFDGVEIDCRITEFPGKAVCSQLKTQIPGVKTFTDKNLLYFSILGPRNASDGKPVKVKRGISNTKDLGRVVEVDGKKQLTLWSTPECNTFKGTDGWIFPPLMSGNEGVWSYSTDLCRSIEAKYVKSTIFKGIHVLLYEADLGDMEHNEEEKCYCTTPKTCLKKGVFDMSKCSGVPIYATLPHFLRTNEIYSQQVKGLNPILEDHIVRVHFEPLTGSPIEARKRIQFNLPIAPNSKIDLMKTIPEALHPIFWIEEGVELEGPLFKKVANIFLFIKIVKVIRWLGIINGVGFLAYGVYLYYKNKKSVAITPTYYDDKASKRLDSNRNSTEEKKEEDTSAAYTNPVLSGHEFDRY